MNRTWLAIIAVVGLGIALNVWIAHSHIKAAAKAPAVEPAKAFEVGSNAEVTERIRVGLEGTSSRCELGAASVEDQADWVRRQEPSELGRLPFAELRRRSDADLSIETSSRLLDKAYRVGLGRMSDAERNVHLINELQGEVVNGGFHQYFANSSGNCASRVGAAARSIDAGLANLVTQALARFPESSPAEDRATRNGQMQALADEFSAWSSLDDDFYKLDLDAPTARYIRTNGAAFTLPGRGE